MLPLKMLPEELHKYISTLEPCGIKTCGQVLKLDYLDLRWLNLKYYVHTSIQTEEANRYMRILLFEDIFSVQDLKEKSVADLVALGFKKFHAKKLIHYGDRIQGSLQEDIKKFQGMQQKDVKERLIMHVDAPAFVLPKAPQKFAQVEIPTQRQEVSQKAF